jgi:beta-phosphoglucomutase
MTQLKAVIFDMDGVLIDSEPLHYLIEREIFEKLGLDVSPEIHRTYLGTATDFMYLDLIARFGLSQSIQDLLKLDELFRCEYFSSLPSLVLNPGVLLILNELRNARIKMSVATSSSPAIANILLERSEIKSYFEVVMTTSEAGKSKPEPLVYQAAANKLGVVPTECLVFEDSPNGLLAAKRAGMTCTVLRTETVSAEELVLADFSIGSFEEITLDQLKRYLK